MVFNDTGDRMQHSIAGCSRTYMKTIFVNIRATKHKSADGMLIRCVSTRTESGTSPLRYSARCCLYRFRL
ncbi:hypothetical protein Ccur_05780 [Cryptobacterium curtum DSM 15641]|uniref:Uncharacterized protein n=1 Tax=Cryptobacterium curtum (strain ATCC 700683 / DSM 15641 / CCUG 43107 / 12-3) TaxID=469378 RepID=C7MN06_CRYCD|nr:hypothetical protein Ccur_05780 [Cryptobacterium curtum DSM 15641]